MPRLRQSGFLSYNEDMRKYLPLGVLFLVAAVLAPACGSLKLRSQQNNLDERVTNYHDSYRWRDYESAGELVQPSVRRDFMAAAEALRNDLNVTDYQIKRISLAESGREATVVVTRSFFKMPSVSVQQQELRQHWILVQGNWYLAGPPY